MSRLMTLALAAIMLAVGLWVGAGMFGGGGAKQQDNVLEADAPDPPTVQAFARCENSKGESYTRWGDPVFVERKIPDPAMAPCDVVGGLPDQVTGGGFIVAPTEARVWVTHSAPAGDGSWKVKAHR